MANPFQPPPPKGGIMKTVRFTARKPLPDVLFRSLHLVDYYLGLMDRADEGVVWDDTRLPQAYRPGPLAADLMRQHHGIPVTFEVPVDFMQDLEQFQ